MSAACIIMIAFGGKKLFLFEWFKYYQNVTYTQWNPREEKVTLKRWFRETKKKDVKRNCNDVKYKAYAKR